MVNPEQAITSIRILEEYLSQSKKSLKKATAESVCVVSNKVSLQTIPGGDAAELSIAIDHMPFLTKRAEKLAQMVRTGLHLKITIEYF